MGRANRSASPRRSTGPLTPSGNIRIGIGDMLEPQPQHDRIVCHFCNDIGLWYGTLARAISSRWIQPEIAYRISRGGSLGHVDFIRVSENTLVANATVMHGLNPDGKGNSPIRYDSLRQAVNGINAMAMQTQSTVHLSRANLTDGGADWETVRQILSETMRVDTYVYG